MRTEISKTNPKSLGPISWFSSKMQLHPPRECSKLCFVDFDRASFSHRLSHRIQVTLKHLIFLRRQQRLAEAIFGFGKLFGIHRVLFFELGNYLALSNLNGLADAPNR